MLSKGNRFTQVYLDRGPPSQDCQRFRNRLAAYFLEKLQVDYGRRIGKALAREAGMHDTQTPAWDPSVQDILKNGQLRDMLDSITIIYQELMNLGKRSFANDWLKFVERALREENLGYSLDTEGGVHFYIDREFERNRISTLEILDLPKFSTVRSAYEDCFRHLDSTPADTKAAIRSIFEALEILIKKMVETNNLNKFIVKQGLKDKCIDLMKGSDPISVKVADKLFDSFAEWVDSIHFYRHGQNTPVPVSPSMDLTVQIISTGSSYLRWLAQFDTIDIAG